MQAVVGITKTCERLATFEGRGAAERAAEYIGTLPKRKEGHYYIDVMNHTRFHIKHIPPKNPRRVKP